MAIQTTSQGTIPSVTVDKVQYTALNISVPKHRTNHRISLSAIVHPYGVDGNGDYVFSEEERKIAIKDIHEFIDSFSGQKLTDAQTAMQKVQEGLGMLIDLYFPDLTYDQYVP